VFTQITEVIDEFRATHKTTLCLIVLWTW